MAFTAEILSVRVEREKHRVTYRFVEGAMVRGPYVQDRPVATNAEHQAWCDSIVPVVIDEVQRLIDALGAADATLLRDALISEGIDYALFDDALIRITGTVTNPRTLQSALVERMGSAATNRIRNKLLAAGYERIIAAGEVAKITL